MTNRIPAVGLTLALLLAGLGCLCADETQLRVIDLALPRPPTATEDVWLKLRVGPLARGEEIRVSTIDGILVGTVSSFGAPQNQGSATYTIPLPKGAIVGGGVRLRLEVDRPDSSIRAAKPNDIEDAHLVYVPSGK